jgi:hypothetical protein
MLDFLFENWPGLLIIAAAFEAIYVLTEQQCEASYLARAVTVGVAFLFYKGSNRLDKWLYDRTFRKDSQLAGLREAALPIVSRKQFTSIEDAREKNFNLYEESKKIVENWSDWRSIFFVVSLSKAARGLLFAAIALTAGMLVSRETGIFQAERVRLGLEDLSNQDVILVGALTTVVLLIAYLLLMLAQQIMIYRAALKAHYDRDAKSWARQAD